MDTDVERALLAAIRSDPGADLPRLVYADWLEENGGRADCPRCRGEGVVTQDSRTPEKALIQVADRAPFGMIVCPRCERQGTVPDARTLRAEFIRLQVEIESHLATAGHRFAIHCKCWPCESVKPLAMRERQLFDELCPKMNGVVHCIPDSAWARGEVGDAATMVHVVRRGFVAEWRGTVGQWCGGECERCHGDTDRHDALTADGRCFDCGGRLRTSGIGPRLVREQPIERVVLTDREPVEIGGGTERHFRWWIENPEREPSQATIPAEIYILIEGSHWTTADAAMLALSAAALAWAKEASSGS